MQPGSTSVLALFVLTRAACQEAASPAASPPAPSPTSSEGTGTAEAVTASAVVPGPHRADPEPPAAAPVAVAMPVPEDVRAALALRCTTRKQGSGCTDAGGKPVIPFEYMAPVVFKQSGLALVRRAEHGWTFVNARNETVFDVFLFDNGPDELREGLAHVPSKNDRDRLRRRGVAVFVIPPGFNSAFGFEGARRASASGATRASGPRRRRPRRGRVLDTSSDRPNPATRSWALARPESAHAAVRDHLRRLASLSRGPTRAPACPRAVLQIEPEQRR